MSNAWICISRPLVWLRLYLKQMVQVQSPGTHHRNWSFPDRRPYGAYQFYCTCRSHWGAPGRNAIAAFKASKAWPHPLFSLSCLSGQIGVHLEWWRCGKKHHCQSIVNQTGPHAAHSESTSNLSATWAGGRIACGIWSQSCEAKNWKLAYHRADGETPRWNCRLIYSGCRCSVWDWSRASARHNAGPKARIIFR